MQTLLIDNHDSFTWNLFGLLAEVNGAEPLVVRNDEAPWEELVALRPDNVVISPGPGRPERAADFGVCAAAIRRAEVPLLGVCLGHQGIGWLAGGEVIAAPAPVHGQVGRVRHSGSPLFAGIPAEFEAVRYHSLCLRLPLPPELEPIAWADDGVLMALAHRSRPRWGVQFHPESIGTEHGRRLLANFRDLTGAAALPSAGPSPAPGPSPSGARLSFVSDSDTKLNRATDDGQVGRESRCEEVSLRTRVLVGDREPEAVYGALCGESEEAFWLDGASGGGRFSFLGTPGPLGARVTYDVERGEVTVRRRQPPTGRSDDGAPQDAVEVRRESIFAYLAAELERLRLPPGDLPFGFDCGFVGCLGYELKAETGGVAAHRSPTPDAALLFADRLVVCDHEDGRTYALALVAAGAEDEADAWFDETVALLESLPLAGALGADASSGPRATGAAPEGVAACNPVGDKQQPHSGGAAVSLRLARSEERYLADIAACFEALRAGESYEICLTNRVRGEVEVDPVGLYRSLRRANPAPHAALLRLGPELSVLSSSPERFLRIGPDGEAEARPIKGTAARAADPAEDTTAAAALAADAKSRAENLMIVDLLRNDLGRVCLPGTVSVPGLFAVESYETVHQLVSTVRGRLRPGAGALEAVRACFPPGSMTGAPKERTMAILDRLEGEARGVYSGAIGWFGLSGEADLSVAIRTLVLREDEEGGRRLETGAGGAIVVGSDPEAELEEMLLKARAPLRALDSSPVGEAPSFDLLEPTRALTAGPGFRPRSRG